MNFVLVPNVHSVYDISQLRELSRSLILLGHDAVVMNHPIFPHPNDVTESNLKALRENLHRPKLTIKELYKRINADCILEVNRLRSNHLPNKVRHISWFQDVRPTDHKTILDYASNVKSGDLIYLLGDKNHFGITDHKIPLRCLLAGINPNLIKKPENLKKTLYDVNLIGYFSDLKDRPRFSLSISRMQFYLQEFVRSPRSLYRLLTREESDFNLDRLMFDKIYIDYEKHFTSAYKPLCGQMILPPLQKMNSNINKRILNRLFTEIPRKQDRLILFEKIFELHQKGKSVFVAGKNAQTLFPNLSFVHSHAPNAYDIFSSSAITLHNNTHGLGIHSRVLEAMAAGSFVMMHGSPHSHLSGGIDSTFERDVHYGLYTADNICEKVENWLDSIDARKRAISQNNDILRAKHLWEYRAKQILRDLK